jgi:hypothetical protein
MDDHHATVGLALARLLSAARAPQYGPKMASNLVGEKTTFYGALARPLSGVVRGIILQLLT